MQWLIILNLKITQKIWSILFLLSNVWLAKYLYLGKTSNKMIFELTKCLPLLTPFNLKQMAKAPVYFAAVTQGGWRVFSLTSTDFQWFFFASWKEAIQKKFLISWQEAAGVYLHKQSLRSLTPHKTKAQKEKLQYTCCQIMHTFVRLRAHSSVSCNLLIYYKSSKVK